MKALLLLAGILLSGTSFADGHGLTTDQVLDAAKIAVDTFEIDRPADAARILGFKSWKSDDEAKVIIYVTSGSRTLQFKYNCHGHDNRFECHAQ